MKPSVSSYSFARLMGPGGMTQLDCVKKAAELGFEAIEFTELQPHDGFFVAVKISVSVKTSVIAVIRAEKHIRKGGSTKQPCGKVYINISADSVAVWYPYPARFDIFNKLNSGTHIIQAV